MEERSCVFIELQCAGESIKDLSGRTLVLALFESEVVVRADAGEHRKLLSTQSGHSPHAETWQTNVLGPDERASRPEVLAQGCARWHRQTLRRSVVTVQGDAVGLRSLSLVSLPPTGIWLARRACGSVSAPAIASPPMAEEPAGAPTLSVGRRLGGPATPR